MFDVFPHDDYRQLLRAALVAKKAEHGRAFTFAKLAEACKLQRPYLSSVLQGNGHLNADQVFLASRFLEFSEDEAAFTELLHARERSATPTRRSSLERQLHARRQAALVTAGHLEAAPLASSSEEGKRDFYLDMNAQLVHMFLTVKRLREQPLRIQQALHLSPPQWQDLLGKIERAGLIRISGTQIQVLAENFHLPGTSPLFPTYRLQMRLKALEHMQSRPSSEHYSFSVLFSAGDAVRQKIHARFLEFIAWAEEQCNEEPATQVYQLNFDLLQWS